MSQNPNATFSIGLCSAAIWRNTDNGNSRYNVTLQRRYKDKEGNWKSTSSYDESDLLAIGSLSQRAFDWIMADRDGEETPF